MWILAAALAVQALGVTAAVGGFALYGPLCGGPSRERVAGLAGATEEEVRAVLGDPDLVLNNQHELGILTTCYESFSYRWVAGDPPTHSGWVRPGQLPRVGQKALWYERHWAEYLIFLDGGRVSAIYKAGT